MIERKKKICRECKEEVYLYARKMCKSCDMKVNPSKHGFTMSSSSPAPKKKKTASKIVKKASGQKILFESIWAVRPHYSFISGLPLDEEPKVHYFAHIIPKGLYPKFKLLDRNITLLNEVEHHLYDFGTESQREDYAVFMLLNHKIFVDWNKLYTLRDELLKEYREL